ncbi:MAG: hypothetical protein Q8853_02625, partial [Candidatus Phytoplasma australasiaticum]|nr:hypothetical protein [Candidatus Phytoplasma australasiaticum]
MLALVVASWVTRLLIVLMLKTRVEMVVLKAKVLMWVKGQKEANKGVLQVKIGSNALQGRQGVD